MYVKEVCTTLTEYEVSYQPADLQLSSRKQYRTVEISIKLSGEEYLRGRSYGTVVNSYNLTTCLSWVQASIGLTFCYVIINKSLKAKPIFSSSTGRH